MSYASLSIPAQVLALGVIALAAPAVADQGDTVLVSRASGLSGEKGSGSGPSVSADGRFVAFHSVATNLHDDDTDDVADVFLRDTLTGETSLVSRATGPDGVKGDWISWSPSVSGDGGLVVFASGARTLDPADSDIFTDIYARDLESNETFLVSRASGANGANGNNESLFGVVSADGRFVAFDSFAWNLHPDAPFNDTYQHVFLRDLQADQIYLVSRANGADGDGGRLDSYVGAVSTHGRFVVYSSWAYNLHPEDADKWQDVFVRDRLTEQNILVSRADGADGEKGDFHSAEPRMSADGRFVAFQSKATNLHPDDNDGGPLFGSDIFVRDLLTNQTILVSRASGADGEKGNSSSVNPRISADGRFVTFESHATNLHPDDTDETRDVFVRDLHTSQTMLVSRASGVDGEKGNSDSFGPSVSADGRFVAFDSVSTNLHPDDPDDNFDVFLRDSIGPPVVEAAGLDVDFEAVDSDGNGVLEAGEIVEVAPMWQNVSAGHENLTGGAFEFIGPGGATYVVHDSTAEYGDVEPGGTASCTDTGVCYSVEIAPAASRPAVHWDAGLGESVSDPNITTKTWTLHVGDSFTDVPRSNLFYSVIETVLHSGVTGGCGDGTAYCPADASTRSQMPIFMLRALEGPGYAPEACAEGEERMFADVPASNLFCSWIEELASRGIVSGCGDDNYCPSDAVTRAQMAIFLLKTLEGPDYEPIECTHRFTDVPCSSIFADWIEDLAAREITGGCTETEYCPSDAVTRGQMASFITRTFGFALYGP